MISPLEPAIYTSESRKMAAASLRSNEGITTKRDRRANVRRCVALNLPRHRLFLVTNFYDTMTLTSVVAERIYLV